ncbi:MAG: iron-sulfur cluster repair di-iron protein [Planctomycetes bacterium]|nr:iron-sulfur cluster repair di-iron protein [Planctomycetota bacterium]
MMTTLAERPLGELVRECVDRARVLERLGIDYCCGGKRTLADACRERGLSAEEVERELMAAGTIAGASENDWSQAPLAELVEDILTRHHAYLRSELPRLGDLLNKVVARHADMHAELPLLHETFAELWDELRSHMMKEERVLFPYIVRLEHAVQSRQALPQFHCSSVLQPIAVMEQEHRFVGEALERIRALTNNHEPPADACNSWRALWNGLAELEKDLHLHIHKENNILFPRAVELEAAVAQNAPNGQGVACRATSR